MFYNCEILINIVLVCICIFIFVFVNNTNFQNFLHYYPVIVKRDYLFNQSILVYMYGQYTILVYKCRLLLISLIYSMFLLVLNSFNLFYSTLNVILNLYLYAYIELRLVLSTLYTETAQLLNESVVNPLSNIFLIHVHILIRSTILSTVQRIGA